jgi:hypothetical protein
VSWLRTYESARNPELPAVSVWPLKNDWRAALSIVPVSIESELPDSAEATPTSATSPLFDAAGFVIAKWNEPSAALASMSFHVTFGLLVQPKRSATLCFTPRITGLSMICCWATIRVPAPGRRAR